MSWFGLTIQSALYAWAMDVSQFAEPPNGPVDNGATIIGDALTRAEAVVKGNLPTRALQLLSRIEGEIVVQDADSGQTTATLAIAASTTTQVVLWVFDEGQYYVNELRKASSYRLKAFTMAADKKTITFTTALTEGQMVIASYPVGLVDNCPSLQSALLDVVAVDLLAPRYPTRPEVIDALQAKRDGALSWLSAIREGDAMLPELMNVRLVVDAMPEDGGVTLSGWRNPQ